MRCNEHSGSCQQLAAAPTHRAAPDRTPHPRCLLTHPFVYTLFSPLSHQPTACYVTQDEPHPRLLPVNTDRFLPPSHPIPPPACTARFFPFPTLCFHHCRCTVPRSSLPALTASFVQIFCRSSTLHLSRRAGSLRPCMHCISVSRFGFACQARQHVCMCRLKAA